VDISLYGGILSDEVEKRLLEVKDKSIALFWRLTTDRRMGSDSQIGRASGRHEWGDPKAN
jgi:hypothetical protein